MTHPDLTPNFEVGDTYQYVVFGAPNKPVYATNNATTPQYIGQTDARGHLVTTGVDIAAWIGSYTQIWSVRNQTASPALTFVVGQFGTSGTVTSTDVGTTPNGHLEGVSSLSITNGVVSTYSATVLDYTAGLYYDSETVATLFDDGAQVNQAVSQITTSTYINLSGNPSTWHDYDLQTDHYAIAYFVSGGSYENPLYWGDSCYAETGDCSVDNSGGGYSYWVTAQAIYLGSTLADQTYVPQDGSLPPLLDQSILSSFGGAQSPQSGPVLNISTWEAVMLATAPAIELAESAYARNGQSFPLPMFLELTDETQVSGAQGQLAARTRTYLVRDSFGRAWDLSHPDITIFERFIKFTNYSGTGGLPNANNPNFPLGTGWSRTDKELLNDGHMSDDIGQIFPQPEVNFLQLFWATGLNGPGLGLPSSIATLGLPPLPGNPSSAQNSAVY